MIRSGLCCFFFCAFALISRPALAQPEKYLLDKPHTQILFSVDHLGYARSFGKFLDYSGFIQWDQISPETSRVEITIPTASLDMGEALWNEHLSAEKYFDVARYPTMTFKSTKIIKTGENTADLLGDLTLRGVTKPVVLKTRFNKAGKHPFIDRMEAGFSATASLKRSDFGMTEAIPFVSDDVAIQIEVEAYREDPHAQGTKNQ
ncbi:MAG TPA: YceI family protein [Alphaproteobacteria bacterium]|nr:YceI family protein [Alphaproteobacteria bacterium]